MNIFVLDLDPKTCASYYCDRHCGKMILESVQLLCTTHNLHNSTSPYKSTHSNHPCRLWVEKSRSNYLWLKELTHYLNEEFKTRYKKSSNHLSFDKMQTLEFPSFLPDLGLTEHPKCMPEHCKKENVVDSYRTYYILDKNEIAQWKYSAIPYWYNL